MYLYSIIPTANINYIPDDKEAMRKKREESFAKAEAREKSRSKMKDEVKRENEQYALKEIMKVYPIT